MSRHNQCFRIGLHNTVVILEVADSVKSMAQFRQTGKILELRYQVQSDAYGFLSLALASPASRLTSFLLVRGETCAALARSRDSASRRSWSICSSLSISLVMARHNPETFRIGKIGSTRFSRHEKSCSLSARQRCEHMEYIRIFGLEIFRGWWNLQPG
jgi:hypothetical protein